MIHVQGLVKAFGEVRAVDGISFDVRAGEIFAFLGPNGAGKTTTIQMLTTLLRPTAGSIAVDGLDPVTRPREVRRRFGIVFQDPSLDGELTAYENMDLHGVLYHVPRRVRAERVEALLKLFELWERRHARVKTFSGDVSRIPSSSRCPSARRRVRSCSSDSTASVQGPTWCPSTSTPASPTAVGRPPTSAATTIGSVGWSRLQMRRV